MLNTALFPVFDKKRPKIQQAVVILKSVSNDYISVKMIVINRLLKKIKMSALGYIWVM